MDQAGLIQRHPIKGLQIQASRERPSWSAERRKVTHQDKCRRKAEKEIEKKTLLEDYVSTGNTSIESIIQFYNGMEAEKKRLFLSCFGRFLREMRAKESLNRGDTSVPRNLEKAVRSTLENALLLEQLCKWRAGINIGCDAHGKITDRQGTDAVFNVVPRTLVFIEAHRTEDIWNQHNRQEGGVVHRVGNAYIDTWIKEADQEAAGANLLWSLPSIIELCTTE